MTGSPTSLLALAGPLQLAMPAAASALEAALGTKGKETTEASQDTLSARPLSSPSGRTPALQSAFAESKDGSSLKLPAPLPDLPDLPGPSRSPDPVVLGGGPDSRVELRADVRARREEGGGWELDLPLIGRHVTGSQGAIALEGLVLRRTGATWLVVGSVPAVAAAAQKQKVLTGELSLLGPVERLNAQGACELAGAEASWIRWSDIRARCPCMMPASGRCRTGLREGAEVPQTCAAMGKPTVGAVAENGVGEELELRLRDEP